MATMRCCLVRESYSPKLKPGPLGSRPYCSKAAVNVAICAAEPKCCRGKHTVTVVVAMVVAATQWQCQWQWQWQWSWQW